MRKKGYVFQKANSKRFWIGYSSNGIRYRESSRSTSRDIAQRLLDRRLREIAEEGVPGSIYERVTFDELAGDLRTDYVVNARKTLIRIEQSINHLNKSFKGMKALKINTATVKSYTAKRLDEGAAPGTINRELTALKRMFNLAFQSEKVNKKPYIPMLQENNVRDGFLEYEQFLILRNNLPEYLQSLVTVAFMTGLRRAELTNLEWKKVFIDKGYLRLDSNDTKNRRPRTVYLSDEALEAIKAAHKNRRLDCGLVFHKDGRRIGDFRNAWNKACKTAGVEGLIFHDLRRSAIRNMVRSGIPERVAMKISGHRTRSVFDRYDITSEQDLRDAASLLNAHLAQRQAQPKSKDLPGS